MVSHFGHVTVQQLLNVLGVPVVGPRRYHDHAWLVDLGGFATTEIGFTDFMRVIHAQEELQKPLKRVRQISIYAPGDLAFGMARMYEQLCNTSDNFDVQVFSDLHEAVDWLDCPNMTPAAFNAIEQSCYDPSSQITDHSQAVTG